MKEIDLKHSRLELRTDGVVIVHCKDDHQFELEEVKEIVRAAGELTGKRRMPTLTIPGKYSQATKEALDFIFSPAAAEFSSKDAFIVQSLSQKLIGNFYLKLKKSDIPTRLFTNEKSAIEWLKKKPKVK